MKTIQEYLKNDDHYFSEGHLEGWFKTQYKGESKEDIKWMLENEHDVIGEIENAEQEIGRELTDDEKEKVIAKFNKSVLKNIVFRKGVAIGYVDSLNDFNS